MELPKGANTNVPTARLDVVLSWVTRAGLDLDASALLLFGDRVRDDDDFVFFNQPHHPTGSVRHLGKSPSGARTLDRLEVDLPLVPSDVERVVLALSNDTPFAAVTDLVVEVKDDTTTLARFRVTDATTETAMVAGELYRRAGAWKFRAVGQGYTNGLAGLATDFGISVEEPTAPAPVVAPTSPASPRRSLRAAGTVPPPRPVTPAPMPVPASVRPAAPTPAPVPAHSPPVPPTPRPQPTSARINLDKGRVSLTKNQSVSLVKTNAPALTRVTLGLGWDEAHSGRSIDLDASVIAFDVAGRDLKKVWFMKQTAYGDAIKHSGDNLTGAGAGDDEQIHVNLAGLPPEVHALVFTINCFTGQRFTEVRRAFCRLVEAGSGAELVRFDLSTMESTTGVIMATLVRDGSSWVMKALGEFHDGRTVRAMVKPAARLV